MSVKISETHEFHIDPKLNFNFPRMLNMQDARVALACIEIWAKK